LAAGKGLAANGGGRSNQRRKTISGSLGQKREDGSLGFGDDISRDIIKGACAQLNGAVRHAAESFNYYWPQDLDDEYLVVWDGFRDNPEMAVPWAYMSPTELRQFLISRIPEGYVFPINPKWIMADAGWFEVYEALEAAPTAQQALEAWMPRHTGLRERIRAVHDRHPHGFVRERRGSTEIGGDGPVSVALAQLALKRYETLRRVKLKLVRARPHMLARRPLNYARPMPLPRMSFALGLSQVSHHTRSRRPLSTPPSRLRPPAAHRSFLDQAGQAAGSAPPTTGRGGRSRREWRRRWWRRRRWRWRRPLSMGRWHCLVSW
jgi:hypothetical protein